MAGSPFQCVVQYARRAALLQASTVIEDADLLKRFIDQQDEAAFEIIVRRHGPMVLGVCVRILRNPHDAEDAFQATFLVLVRKAAAIRPGSQVGKWLHGVARITALRARAAAAKRRVKETTACETHLSRMGHSDLWNELWPVLDAELGKLPDKYRNPILLCDLENRTIRDAANQLGWPQGTVAGRLARGRKMLARRLSRHGTVFSAGLVATLLGRHATGAVPRFLLSSTVTGASRYAKECIASAGLVSSQVLALTEGVYKAMVLSKLRIGAALFSVCLFGLGAGMCVYAGSATEPTPSHPASAHAVTVQDKQPADEEPNAVEGVKWGPSQSHVQFQVDMQIAKKAGEDEMSVVAEPKLQILEGKEGTFISGGDTPVPGERHGTTVSVETGVRTGVKVFGRDDGRLRLECWLENSAIEKLSDEQFEVKSRSTRSIRFVKLGEPVDISLEGADGKVYSAKFKVTDEKCITTRSRLVEKLREGN